MSQGGRGPSLGRVVAVIVGSIVVTLVVSNARGHKDGCEADGGQMKGFKCVKEQNR